MSYITDHLLQFNRHPWQLYGKVIKTFGCGTVIKEYSVEDNAKIDLWYCNADTKYSMWGIFSNPDSWDGCYLGNCILGTDMVPMTPKEMDERHKRCCIRCKPLSMCKSYEN